MIEITWAVVMNKDMCHKKEKQGGGLEAAETHHNVGYQSWGNGGEKRRQDITTTTNSYKMLKEDKPNIKSQLASQPNTNNTCTWDVSYT